MLVIRNKKQHHIICRFGFVTQTENNPMPLGEFDPLIWEQIELSNLPPNFVLKTASDNYEILHIITGVLQKLPVTIRLELAELRSVLFHLLECNDIEAAILLIEQQRIDEEIKLSLLNCFK